MATFIPKPNDTPRLVKPFSKSGDDIFAKYAKETKNKMSHLGYEQIFFMQDSRLLDGILNKYDANFSDTINNLKQNHSNIQQEIVENEKKIFNTAAAPFNFLEPKIFFDTDGDFLDKDIRDNFSAELASVRQKMSENDIIKLIKKEKSLNGKEIPFNTRVLYNSKPELVQFYTLQKYNDLITGAVYGLLQFASNSSFYGNYYDNFIAVNPDPELVKNYKYSSFSQLFAPNAKVSPELVKFLGLHEDGLDEFIVTINQALTEGFTSSATSTHKKILSLLMALINNSTSDSNGEFKLGSIDDTLFNNIANNSIDIMAGNFSFDAIYKKFREQTCQSILNSVEKNYESFKSSPKYQTFQPDHVSFLKYGIKTGLLNVDEISSINKKLGEKIINNLWNEITETEISELKNVFGFLGELENSSQMQSDYEVWANIDNFKEYLKEQNVLSKTFSSRITGGLIENLNAYSIDNIVVNKDGLFKSYPSGAAKAVELSGTTKLLLNTNATPSSNLVPTSFNNKKQIKHGLFGTTKKETDRLSDYEFALKSSVLSISNLNLMTPELYYSKTNLPNVDFYQKLFPNLSKEELKMFLLAECNKYKSAENHFKRLNQKGFSKRFNYDFPPVLPFNDNCEAAWNNFSSKILKELQNKESNFFFSMIRLPLVGGAVFRHLDEDSIKQLLDFMKDSFGPEFVNQNVVHLSDSEIAIKNIFQTPSTFLKKPESAHKRAIKQYTSQPNFNKKEIKYKLINDKEKLKVAEKYYRKNLLIHKYKPQQITAYDKLFSDKKEFTNIDIYNAISKPEFSQNFLITHSITAMSNRGSTRKKLINKRVCSEIASLPSLLLNPNDLSKMRFRDDSCETCATLDVSSQPSTIESVLDQNLFTFASFYLFNNPHSNDFEINQIFNNYFNLASDSPEKYAEFLEFQQTNKKQIKEFIKKLIKQWNQKDFSSINFMGDEISHDVCMNILSASQKFTTLTNQNDALLAILQQKNNLPLHGVASISNINKINQQTEYNEYKNKDKDKFISKHKDFGWLVNYPPATIPSSVSVDDKEGYASIYCNSINDDILPESLKSLGFYDKEDVDQNTKFNKDDMFFGPENFFDSNLLTISRETLQEVKEKKSGVKKPGFSPKL